MPADTLPQQHNAALQAKLDEAAAKAESRDGKTEAIIWTNVLACAGMGAIPLGINVWTFVAANVTMIVAIGHVYGYTVDREQAAALLKQIFGAVGITWAASVLGLKLFAEVLKGAGVITMGGTTVGGMALDAVLGGSIAYALGYTARTYFRNNSKLTKEEMNQIFRSSYAEGRTKVQQAVKDKASGKG